MPAARDQRDLRLFFCGRFCYHEHYETALRLEANRINAQTEGGPSWTNGSLQMDSRGVNSSGHP